MKDQLVFLDCPDCGGRCPLPFIRGQVHHYVHRRGANRAPCRFIVDVDPMADDHEFYVLSSGEHFEDILPEILESSDRAKRELRTTFLRQARRIDQEAS